MDKDKKCTKGPAFDGNNSTTIMCEKFGMDKDDDYNPYEHRDMSQSNSSLGSLVHLLKSSLGTGILSMPIAFKYSGLLVGTIGTFLITLLCLHCVQIFVQTSHKVCKKKKISSLGYGETIESVFEVSSPSFRKYGPFMRGFVDFTMSAACLGSSCVYMIFVATSFQSVINNELNVNWDVRYYILGALLPCLVLGNIRNLKHLVPFSSISNVCIVATCAITLWYIFDGPLNISETPLYSGWGNLPLFFSTVIFAVDGIAVVMPVENTMKNPKHLLANFGVLNIAMTIVMVLYGSLGFFGYVRFGNSIEDSITSNLPKDSLAVKMAQILIGSAVLLSFGLKIYIPMDILWQKISINIPKEKHNIWQICIRSGSIILLGGISVAVPRIGPFIGFAGAVFVSILAVAIPALVETVHRYPNEFGFGYWILIKNILLVMLSVVAAVTGSNSSLQQIFEMYK